MKVKLIRDKNGKLVAVDELGPNDDGRGIIGGELSTEIIEAPEDYSKNIEKFFKEHQK